MQPRLTPAVYIVGAGPGDPELLTLKAHRLLSQADVVVYADSLVPPQLLEIAKPEAELVQTAHQTLETILPLIIDRVRSQQSVVRLQSGDPSLFSAVHEQLQALAAADIPCEVVPGISTYQAAAARLQVELTVPKLVQTIILTRIGGRTSMPASEELASLAAHQASLCLYLSARHVEKAQAKLLEHYPPQTPVAVCFRLGWPDEQLWVVPLCEMAQTTRSQQLERTTTYLISPALDPAWAPSARSQLYHPDYARLFRPALS
ncbi:MAG TPA: precorrin-4 C(11)-methyltransferase [Stenomitos sp.]